MGDRQAMDVGKRTDTGCDIKAGALAMEVGILDADCDVRRGGGGGGPITEGRATATHNVEEASWTGRTGSTDEAEQTKPRWDETCNQAEVAARA